MDASSAETLPPGKAMNPPKKRRPGDRRTRNSSRDLGPRPRSTLEACTIVFTAALSFRFGLLRRLRLTECRLDALQQSVHGERFADVVDHTKVLGVGLVAAALVGGDHDDRRCVRFAL